MPGPPTPTNEIFLFIFTKSLISSEAIKSPDGSPETIAIFGTNELIHV